MKVIVIFAAIVITGVLASCNFLHTPASTIFHEPPATDGRNNGQYSLYIVPTVWKFHFESGSHHLKDFKLWTDIDHYFLDRRDAVWNSHQKFNDINADDNYEWGTQYTIFGIPYSYDYYGESPLRYKSNSTVSESFQSNGLARFDHATVVVRGWRFGFVGDDHELRNIGIRIHDISYDRDTGSISWTVKADLADKNGDDNFFWAYQWLIIACNYCSMTDKTWVSTDGGGGTLQVVVSACMPLDSTNDMPSPMHSVVLPHGWFYGMNSGDDDIKTIELGLEKNVSNGTLDELCLHNTYFDTDHNHSEEISTVLIEFQNGGADVYPNTIPIIDGSQPGARFEYWFVPAKFGALYPSVQNVP